MKTRQPQTLHRYGMYPAGTASVRPDGVFAVVFGCVEVLCPLAGAAVAESDVPASLLPHPAASDRTAAAITSRSAPGMIDLIVPPSRSGHRARST